MTEGPGTDTPDVEALQAAFRRLLVPLAKLAVSKGLPYAAVDEWLRTSFVKAAYQAHPEVPAHRRASRVSAATGLHRREVQRLLDDSAPVAAPARSLAAEVFAHWRNSAEYVDARRQPRVLPRTGPAPSFETLAQSITRDVHPRTLLEELLRLNLARRDEAADTVELSQRDFVPSGDLVRMAGFLGDNVGDHLSGAVANVLGGSSPHFEQAVFASGLSDASMAELRTLILAQWQALTEQIVPALERMLERDQHALEETQRTPEANLRLPERDGPLPTPRLQRHRVRVGLYSFQACEADVDEAQSASTASPEADEADEADKGDKADQADRPAKPVVRRASPPRSSSSSSTPGTASSRTRARRPAAAPRGKKP